MIVEYVYTFKRKYFTLFGVINRTSYIVMFQKIANNGLYSRQDFNHLLDQISFESNFLKMSSEYVNTYKNSLCHNRNHI